MKTLMVAVLLSSVAASGAFAQALDTGATKPIAELLNDGFVVGAPMSNGRPGDVVLVLQKDKKHYVCTLSEIRGAGYGEAKPKPVANPCTPLN